jgi:hypothetical protein
VEKFLVLLGGKVWRCEACRVRFVRWWKWPIFSEKAEQRVRQVWQLCVVLAGALFVVYALLWMMNRGGGSPTEGG